jgi:glycosidase
MYRSRMGTAGAEPWCGQNGYPDGPTYHDAPHASSEDGGIGLAPQQVLVNFLDNHDLPRFLFEAGDPAILDSGLFYLMTWDGIPCLYYGTEQLFDGGVDPQNREDMFSGNPERGFAPFDTTHETFARFRDLIAMRKQHIALRRGDVDIRWATDRGPGQRDAGIFAFERVHPEEKLLVVLNTTGSQDSETCAPVEQGGACMLTTFAPGTVLRDVVPGSDGATFTVAPDGTVAVTVSARGGRVLAP